MKLPALAEQKITQGKFSDFSHAGVKRMPPL